jgi:hypothetical protein
MRKISPAWKRSNRLFSSLGGQAHVIYTSTIAGLPVTTTKLCKGLAWELVELAPDACQQVETLDLGWRACSASEYKRMTIYRTRYHDPKEHRRVSAWAETRVGAEMRRGHREAVCTAQDRDRG